MLGYVAIAVWRVLRTVHPCELTIALKLHCGRLPQEKKITNPV